MSREGMFLDLKYVSFAFRVTVQTRQLVSD